MFCFALLSSFIFKKTTPPPSAFFTYLVVFYPPPVVINTYRNIIRKMWILALVVVVLGNDTASSVLFCNVLCSEPAFVCDTDLLKKVTSSNTNLLHETTATVITCPAAVPILNGSTDVLCCDVTCTVYDCPTLDPGHVNLPAICCVETCDAQLSSRCGTTLSTCVDDLYCQEKRVSHACGTNLLQIVTATGITYPAAVPSGHQLKTGSAGTECSTGLCDGELCCDAYCDNSAFICGAKQMKHSTAAIMCGTLCTDALFCTTSCAAHTCPAVHAHDALCCDAYCDFTGHVCDAGYMKKQTESNINIKCGPTSVSCSNDLCCEAFDCSASQEMFVWTVSWLWALVMFSWCDVWRHHSGSLRWMRRRNLRRKKLRRSLRWLAKQSALWPHEQNPAAQSRKLRTVFVSPFGLAGGCGDDVLTSPEFVKQAGEVDDMLQEYSAHRVGSTAEDGNCALAALNAGSSSTVVADFAQDRADMCRVAGNISENLSLVLGSDDALVNFLAGVREGHRLNHLGLYLFAATRNVNIVVVQPQNVILVTSDCTPGGKGRAKQIASRRTAVVSLCNEHYEAVLPCDGGDMSVLCAALLKCSVLATLDPCSLDASPLPTSCTSEGVSKKMHSKKGEFFCPEDSCKASILCAAKGLKPAPFLKHIKTHQEADLHFDDSVLRHYGLTSCGSEDGCKSVFPETCEVCPTCSRKLGQPVTLEIHSCDTCTASFSSAHLLQGHKNKRKKAFGNRLVCPEVDATPQAAVSQSSDTPSVCPLCKERFSSERGYKNHARTVQDGLCCRLRKLAPIDVDMIEEDPGVVGGGSHRAVAIDVDMVEEDPGVVGCGSHRAGHGGDLGGGGGAGVGGSGSGVGGHGARLSTLQRFAFVCPECRVGFTIRQNMSLHIWKVHPVKAVTEYFTGNPAHADPVNSGKPFACLLCSKLARNEDDLLGHIDTLHGGIEAYRSRVLWHVAEQGPQDSTLAAMRELIDSSVSELKCPGGNPRAQNDCLVCARLTDSGDLKRFKLSSFAQMHAAFRKMFSVETYRDEFLSADTNMPEIELRRSSVNVSSVNPLSGEFDSVDLMLHRRAYDPDCEEGQWVCSECMSTLRRYNVAKPETYKMPAAAIANGLFLGRLHSVLCEPTRDFCRFVALATPFLTLTHVKGVGRAMKGNTAILPSKIVSVTKNLPPPTRLMEDHFVVAFTSGAAGRQGNDLAKTVRRWRRVNTADYLSAVSFLKKNSPVYANVTVNEDAYQAISDGETPGGIEVDITKGGENEMDQAEKELKRTISSTLPDNDGDEAETVHAVHMTSADFMSDTMNLAPALRRAHDLLTELDADKIDGPEIQAAYCAEVKKTFEDAKKQVTDLSDAASSGSGRRSIEPVVSSLSPSSTPSIEPVVVPAEVEQVDPRFVIEIDHENTLTMFDDMFWPKAFPELFPFGVLATPYLSNRKTPLTLSQWASILLHRSEMEYGTKASADNPHLEEEDDGGELYVAPKPRFRGHATFICVAHNLNYRLNSLNAAKAHVTKSTFCKTSDAISRLVSDPKVLLEAVKTLENAGSLYESLRHGNGVDEDLKKVLRSMNFSQASVVGSDSRRVAMRHQANAYLMLFGLPQVFMTPNLTVRNELANFVYSQKQDYCQDEAPTLPTLSELNKSEATDPVGHVKKFGVMMDLLFRKLLRVKILQQNLRKVCASDLRPGCLGTLSAALAPCETNGHGFVHPHMLLFEHSMLHKNNKVKRLLFADNSVDEHTVHPTTELVVPDDDLNMDTPMADNENPANNSPCATAAVTSDGVGSGGPEMIRALPAYVGDVVESAIQDLLPHVADNEGDESMQCDDVSEGGGREDSPPVRRYDTQALIAALQALEKASLDYFFF